MSFAATRLFFVSVRYRTRREGYFTRRYEIQAETAELAKHEALMRAFRLRGSTMHEAEITVA